jgi:filamentous hemagglutinin family protein
MSSNNCGEYKLNIITVIALTTCTLILDNRNAQAQIISDRTTNTQVQVTNNLSSITGGTQVGQNLFHSFEQFSLITNEIANFDHAVNINNIFSRVTGGSVSQIDGLIQTQGNANLFLLNPVGIIFGANAQLNIGGSFIATTGDRLIFADGSEFSAINPETKPLLTISSPVGLQYGSSPGEITVLPNANRASGSSGLNIKPGNTLALLGGDVTINRNSLNGFNSNIEISSIQSGSVALKSAQNGWEFDYQNAGKLGKLDLTNRALVSTSGMVNLHGSTINLSSGSGIRNLTDRNGNGGIIKLEAQESIKLDGGLLLTQVGQIRSDIDQAITDAGGNILLKAPQISFTNGSIIAAGTLSEGAGGNITIDASDLVELYSQADNNPPIITTSTQGKGAGGSITVNTGKLNIYNGSQIQALAGEGAGGTITVNASQAVDISGKGILKSRDNPSGTLRDREGNLSETELTSGLVAASGIKGLPLAQQPQGESGSLVINTPNLKIDNEAEISVSNFGLANAGNIAITTSTLNLDNAATITANTQSGKGGSINVTADDLVILDNQSAISTTAQQNGDGGNISVATDNLVLLELNKINADAQQGSGGKITINTQGIFINPNSTITASSDLKQKTGIVKIVTLETNSKIQTENQERSPLIAEKYTTTSCGVGEDFSKNQFRNLGRGGIPNNVMQETTNIESLGDLGKVSHRKTANLVKRNYNHVSQLPAEQPSLTEAQAWIINSQGKIELIAPEPTAILKQQSACNI